MTIIREAERSDLRAIPRLHRDASEYRGRLDRQPGAEIRGSDSERFLHGVQSLLGRRSCCVFVATNDAGDAPVGYVMGSVVDNKPFSLSQYGYISCLYVDEEIRGCGMGGRLLGAIRDWFKARGLKAAHVDVSCDDARALRYWQGRGFGEFLDHLYRDVEPEYRQGGPRRFEVREAQAGDEEAVILLWKEMIDSHARIDERLSVGPAWRDEVAQSVRQWMEDHGSHIVVAEANDGVIGFALGGLVEVSSGMRPATYGHIAHLCVGAGWRRRGVGSLLCSSLRDWFCSRGVSSIHLYVSHFNPVSQQFWRSSMGFDDCMSRLWCDLT